MTSTTKLSTRKSDLLSQVINDDKLLLNERYKTWNPRSLHSVQSLVDAGSLVPVYSRDRSGAAGQQWTEEHALDTQHPIRQTAGGLYTAVRYRERPKFETRDRYGLLFLNNLEVHKQDLGELGSAMGKYRRHIGHDNNLPPCGRVYSRNWAVTEDNEGKDYRQFITQ